jgi:hypothetical protein
MEELNERERAVALRAAIEYLITVKLLDVIASRGGLERLIAHRESGVASPRWD